jgi:hypothetical protein
MEVHHRHLERHLSAAAVIAGSLSTVPLEPRPQRTGRRSRVSGAPMGARIVPVFSVFLLLGLCSVIGLADAPLRPPSPVTVCSNSKIFCLLTDPKTGTHAYRVRPDGSRQPLWSMPGWYRVIFLADDGRHAVTGYDGALLPLDYSPDEPLLTFWRDGSRIRAIPVSGLVKDLRKLQRTSSHYRWGSYVGFNAAGNLVVSTVERESVAFDVTTGKEVGR